MNIPTDKNDIHETRTGYSWFGQDGIVRVIAKPATIHGMNEAKAFMRWYESSTQRRHPLLVDMSNVSSQSREVQQYYMMESEKHFTAIALMTKSAISRVLGNFYIGMNKQSNTPVRLFEDEEKAESWLVNYL